MKGRVLVAAPVHSVLTNGLRKMGFSLAINEKISQAEAPGLIGDFEGIVTSTRLVLDAQLLQHASKLKWIARMGSGMEIIDLDFARAKGITCFSSPEGNANAVGEHAVGMLLSLIRNINTSNLEVKDDNWLREENRGIELEGRTIGLIGYGHTGPALAKKLRGFDMNILVYDKYKPNFPEDGVTALSDLNRIFDEAEIVSFHLPLTAETHHYFNEDFLYKMRRPFILVNTSRGTVIETTALAEGLQTGKILGACLDVLEYEPIAKMPGEYKQLFDEIKQLDNVIITPHIAGYTHEALHKMSEVLLKKLQGFIV